MKEEPVNPDKYYIVNELCTLGGIFGTLKSKVWFDADKRCERRLGFSPHESVRFVTGEDQCQSKL